MSHFPDGVIVRLDDVKLGEGTVIQIPFASLFRAVNIVLISYFCLNLKHINMYLPFFNSLPLFQSIRGEEV